MELEKKYGFEQGPIKGSINTQKSPKKTNLSKDKFDRYSQSFRKTMVYVPNENMLDGFQRMCINKYLRSTY